MQKRERKVGFILFEVNEDLMKIDEKSNHHNTLLCTVVEMASQCGQITD